MSASYLVFCRGESYLCFAVAVLPALSTLNEIKNDGKPVRNVVRTRKRHQSLPKSRLQLTCCKTAVLPTFFHATTLQPQPPPQPQSLQNNPNIDTDTKDDQATRKGTLYGQVWALAEKRRKCWSPLNSWGEMIASCQAGQTPQSMTLPPPYVAGCLHLNDIFFLSSLPGGASVLLFFHHIHASASSECHDISQTPSICISQVA